MNSNLPSYVLGATLINVGLSATVRVVQPEFGNGCFFKISSGAGTLSIVSGMSSIVSQGYWLAAGEAVSIMGPSTFYLAASGATMTAAVCLSYSQGKLGT